MPLRGWELADFDSVWTALRCEEGFPGVSTAPPGLFLATSGPAAPLPTLVESKPPARRLGLFWVLEIANSGRDASRRLRVLSRGELVIETGRWVDWGLFGEFREEEGLESRCFVRLALPSLECMTVRSSG